MKEAVESLTSEECHCGRKKGRKKAFCLRCWNKFPKDLQRKLYQRIGSGFEEAVFEAREYLKGGKFDVGMARQSKRDS